MTTSSPLTRRAAEEAEAAVAEEAAAVAEVAAGEAEAMVDAGDLSEAGAAAQVCVEIKKCNTCGSTAVCYSFFSFYNCF